MGLARSDVQGRATLIAVAYSGAGRDLNPVFAIHFQIGQERVWLHAGIGEAGNYVPYDGIYVTWQGCNQVTGTAGHNDSCTSI